MRRDRLARTLLIPAILLAIALTPQLGIVKKAAAQPVNYDVSISNLSFKPSPITIHSGNDVTWSNKDPLIYELYFMDAHGKSFALSPFLQPGGAYTLAFAIPPSTYCNYQYVTIESSVTVIGTVRVLMQGDVNGDNKVDISDLALVGAHFGATIGSPGYLPAADLNNDGVINIIDLVYVAAQFGQNGTPC